MVDVLKRSLAAEVLASFGEARLPVNGFSMFPCMRPGDLLEIRRANGPIPIGEVVVFERHGHLVVHRVIRQSDACLITQGDRLYHPDEPVPIAEILGCVTAIERRGKCLTPKLTPARRIVSTVLRPSEFAARILHYSARMVRT